MTRRRSLLALLLTMLAACALVANARGPAVAEAASTAITTIAGGGAGDGGGAASAAVSPYGVAVDGAGNLYIADGPHCRVRKVAGGMISTVAGTGVCGYSGDNGAGASARIGFVSSVSFDDAAGALYLADTDNCRIRRLLGGTITTVAGMGACGYAGDDGAATSAALGRPRGVVAAPGGILYIADTDNCRVRKVAAGTITTIAGSGVCGYQGDGGAAGSARIDHPYGVGVDSTGTLYVADTENCRLRVVIFPSAVINTTAGTGTCGFNGDGPAISSQLNRPRGLATDAAGDVLIADTDNCRIRKVRYPTAALSTFAGGSTCGPSGDGGAATSAQLASPWGVGVAGGGDVSIADSGNCRLRSVTGTTIGTVAGNGFCDFAGDGGPATDAAISDVSAVALDGAGNIYLADTTNCRIRKVTPGGVISTVAGKSVCGFDGDGPATTIALDHPRGLAADAAGNLWIADTDNCRVRRRDAGTGVLTTVAGSGVCGYGGDNGSGTSAMLNFPQGVAVSGSTVYIADTLNCRVRKLSASIITTYAGSASCAYDGDGGPPASARLTFPAAIAAGNGTLYISDTGDCRVRRVSGGTISLVAGNGVCGLAGDGGAAPAGSLDEPAGLAASPDGAVLVADAINCRVRLVAGAQIATIAGAGTGSGIDCGFAGDGGPATSARLNQPLGVAFDGSGNIIVADTLSRRIRRIAAGSDIDDDGVADVSDDCPSTGDPLQANNDRNFINLHVYGKSFDDLTVANSDAAGDACDPNDDNDGLTDVQEAGIGPGGATHYLCPSASANLNPTENDSDGDRVLDGAECALGSDPASAGSVPPFPSTADDTDRDRLSNSFEAIIGTDPAKTDTDGDGLADGVEYLGYNSSPLSSNGDGDTCGDAREAASVNGDQTVNAGDLGLVASSFGPSSGPNYLADFDANRDGAIGAGDLGFTASKFGAC